MDPRGRRVVYILGSTSLVNDLSSEAIYSILPYYVTDPTLVGIFGGLFNGLGSALKAFFGYLSDRLGVRKPIVMLGYGLSALAKTLMAIVSLPLLPVMIVLDRLGKGIRDSPRDAILGTLEERGYAFGIHRAMDTTGALLGTLLAYVLLKHFGGNYQLAMLIAGLIGFLTVIILLPLPEFRVDKKNDDFVSSVEHLNAPVKHFLLPAMLFGATFVSPMLFISGAKDELALGAILLYALYNLSYVLSSLYLGKRSDILGRKRVMAVGAVSAALAFVLMYVASLMDSWVAYGAAFALYGVGIGAFLPSAFAHVGDLAKAKGTAMGAFQTVFGLAVLVSSSIFGYLMGIFGNVVFLTYALVPVLALMLV